MIEMRRNVRRALVLCTVMASTAGFVACGGIGGSSGGGGATSPQEFYQGKTLTIITPYSPGGGFDTFVRNLVPRLEDQLGGIQVEARNQPGAGGLVGANKVYQAKPDGLTIGLINYPGTVFAEAAGKSGVEFDNSKWTILGRLAAINPLVYTGKNSGYPKFSDILNAVDPVAFGLGGVGSDAYYATVIMAEVLGFPHRIVAGYPGSKEADAALIAGEVDASVNSAAAAAQTIKASGAHPVVFISTEPNTTYPKVPLITDYGDAKQQKTLTALAALYDLERIMVGPPGVPNERARYLADAIRKAASDPAYTKEMEAAGYPPRVLGRAKTNKLVQQVVGSIDTLTPLIK